MPHHSAILTVCQRNYSTSTIIAYCKYFHFKIYVIIYKLCSRTTGIESYYSKRTLSHILFNIALSTHRYAHDC